MRRDEAEAIALAGGQPARALVAELIERLEALTGQVGAGIEQVAALAAEVEELKRIVGRDSQNSSSPPSSDPPKSRAERSLSSPVRQIGQEFSERPPRCRAC